MDESKHVIVHYGKPGMQWGVRLYQNKDGSLTSLGKLRYGKSKGNNKNSTVTINAKKLFSVVSKKVKKSVSSVAKGVSEHHEVRYKSKHPEAMTDEELNAVVNRLQMEKRYRDMMNERAEANTGVGRKLVKKLLAKSGDAAVDALVQGPIRKRFDNLFANLNPKNKPGNNSNNNSQQNSANNNSSTSADANSSNSSSSSNSASGNSTGGGDSGNQSSRRRNRNQRNAPTE